MNTHTFKLSGEVVATSVVTKDCLVDIGAGGGGEELWSVRLEKIGEMSKLYQAQMELSCQFYCIGHNLKWHARWIIFQAHRGNALRLRLVNRGQQK